MSQETLKYGSKGRILLTYSDRGEQAIRQGDSKIAESWFDQAAEYWKQAIALTPAIAAAEAAIGLAIVSSIARNRKSTRINQSNLSRAL
ncbi:hypothetical protein KIW84_011956 [Lathyrus oleraceus]|uniref:Uncharacterized protein n=1 Tax=Pisum sativum TaxID=3888 RepID=A0A9D5GVH6_PEA|nr:hypothetical protein KIW84_011956 [Pisum sativum]